MFYLGPHACEEALNQGRLHTIRITSSAWDRCIKLRLAAREQGVVVHCEPIESLDRRCRGQIGQQRHQGILGEGEAIAMTDLTSLLLRVKQRGASTLILALDGVTDPNNFGAIIRSAAGAGVDGVIFPERRSAQINETVIRASAGNTGRVPLIRVMNLTRALEELKKVGAWIYGLSKAVDSGNYLDEPFDRATVLVLGSEGNGLHQKVREHCDALLWIDMPGGIESLNVSSTAAVMLFRVLAQRRIGRV